MRRYGQVCPLARALDVVGERWSLLIIRELLLGPRRYSDLLDGLPGIGTNVLADRLRKLHEHAVVTRRTLPPPAAVAVYELTEIGRELGPSLAALRQWGVRHAPPTEPGDAKRPSWALLSVVTGTGREAPRGACELHVGPEVFHLTGGDGGLAVRVGALEAPDATISMETESLYQMVAGELTAEAAGGRASVEGDGDIAAGFLAALQGTPVAPA